VQGTMSLLRNPGCATADPEYWWLAVRALDSKESAWRFLPADGFGLLRTELTTIFADWYVERRYASRQCEEWGCSYRTEHAFRFGLRAAYFDIDSHFQSPVFPRQTDE